MFPNNNPNMNLNNINNFNYEQMMIYNQMMNNQMMNNQMINNQMMNNQMMNIMLQNQMNQNNQNNNNQNEEEPVMHIFYHTAYDDILKELTDQKKTIIFKDPINNKSITKQIPIYFTKNELYSLVNGVNMAKTILMYEKNILDDDDSSINDIPNNSTIFLFLSPSYNKFKHSGLYKYLYENYPNNQIINVIVKIGEENYNFAFSEDFPISLMIKLFYALFGTNNRYLFNNKTLKINDNRKIGDLLKTGAMIIATQKRYVKANYFNGKQIKVTMFYKNRNIFKFYSISKYSPISELFKLDDDNNLNNKKIIYNGKELNKNDKHSLASLGINNDFGCIVEEI